MSRYEVIGGNKIIGETEIQGAKNSVLPILAATVLNRGKNVIHNIPRLLDVEIMIKILQSVGCGVIREENTLIVDSSSLNDYVVPENLVREMRSSIIFLGAMLSSCKKVKISYPGGYEYIWEI